jgi:hypothetical protein
MTTPGSFEEWRLRQIKEYLEQEAEDRRFEEELNGDYSVENIKKVIDKRLYSEKGLQQS